MKVFKQSRRKTVCAKEYLSDVSDLSVLLSKEMQAVFEWF